MSEEQKQAALSAIPVPDCPTCRGNGMIGGPSYHAPDEGGVPCPDCWVPSAGDESPHANQSALKPDERAVLRDLAQALAWQCFGECRGYSERLLSPIEALAAVRDVLGIPVAQTTPQDQPSDKELDALWREGSLRNDLEPSYRGMFRWAARALLSRYGAAPQADMPLVPDAAWEALQRMIEDGATRGPASREDALLVARYRRRVFGTPQAGEDAQPVAWRAWFDQDSGARWLFTLWPKEERLDVQWQPLYATQGASHAGNPG
ncbi:hypothetical protein [Cupriavidus basilensis]|uniref:hypothetical protein n=1 Tax=Cupriavidus basilensis TaxID=68895 RepID=UPI000751740D|nr:hypothetical protein [Cupriavidus basilensis]